ncbi:hypothetical protein AIGOOFII_1237 [Methylobacterium marchantiae]|nr:hypothetical protein AIGOOFII_1237 [Methylobacterium marchantiae]
MIFLADRSADRIDTLSAHESSNTTPVLRKRTAHSITAAFMITTMIALAGSVPTQRTVCGRSQR